jgi:hypothetical protein
MPVGRKPHITENLHIKRADVREIPVGILESAGVRWKGR